MGVLDVVAPFQRKALRQRGRAWVLPADEFYRNAYGEALLDHLPSTEFYGGFDMFEDGIGIIRSTVNDWREMHEEGTITKFAIAMRKAGLRARMVAGSAQRDFLVPLVRESGIGDVFAPLYVRNDFFGGNVDVTGLLVGADIVRAIQSASREKGGPLDAFFAPRVVFNDSGVTLDGMTLEDMGKAAGVEMGVVSCSPREYFEEMRVYANCR